MTAAEGITAKFGPQIDQSDCAIRQNECLPYNKFSYRISYFRKIAVQNVNKQFLYITDLQHLLFECCLHTYQPDAELL